MKDNKINISTLYLIGLIVLAALTRMIPHELNVSPLGAIALFGGAWFATRWQSFAIPLAATFLSDLYLNNTIYASAEGFRFFYDGWYFQYLAYAMIVFWSIYIQPKAGLFRMGLGVLGSVGIFYLVTNAGCFVGANSPYPANFGGFMACMAAGIPFVKATFVSDLCFSLFLFGAAWWVEQRLLIKQRLPAEYA